MQVMRVGQLTRGIAMVVLTAGLGSATTGAAAETPTFTEDVAPILYKNCVVCHRAGEIGLMSLMTYAEARPWSRSIKNKVMTGEMPPWHADPAVGRFLNDRRLSDAERETIVEWVDAGAPEGEPTRLPAAPIFSDGWQIGTPDVIIEMPEAFDVPAEGEVAYQRFTLPTGFTEDRWVRAVEVRAGFPSVVHHILAYARTPGAQRRPSAFRQVPIGAPTQTPSARAREGDQRVRQPVGGATELIGTMAPGMNPMVLEAGHAIRVPKDTEVVFQIHYTTNGQPTSDRSRIGMIFADEPPELEVRIGAFINSEFEIPPGEARQRVDAAIEFTEDALIHRLFPHSHLRGYRWDYALVYPDGQREPVLSVPHYDFNWQTDYHFEEPIRVPKGARIEASAWYDNSLANKANPDPTTAVRWGEQTWEEMHYTGVTYSVLLEP